MRDRRAKGLVLGGKRAGIWHYSLDDEVRFVVQFDRGEPVDPPAGWIDDAWPRPHYIHYELDRQLLELMTELSYSSIPHRGERGTRAKGRR